MEISEKTVSAKSANGTNGTLAPARCHNPLGYGTGTNAEGHTRPEPTPRPPGPAPPRYVIVLTPAPGPWQAPPVKRLARFLKAALRGYGLRCVDAREVRTPDGRPATPPAPTGKPALEPGSP